jgi:hypothetical protein
MEGTIGLLDRDNREGEVAEQATLGAKLKALQ